MAGVKEQHVYDPEVDVGETGEPTFGGGGYFMALSVARLCNI
jgi:hypothetical protein